MVSPDVKANIIFKVIMSKNEKHKINHEILYAISCQKFAEI